MSPAEAPPRPRRGLLDTSVLIAAENGRPLATGRLPEASVLSVITLAELRAGVLAAGDPDVRARRLATIEGLADVELVPVDDAVAAAWARLRVALAAAGRRMDVNDLWIAATALAHEMPIVTQDDDFEALAEISEVRIVRV